MVIALACTKDSQAFAEIVRRHHNRVRHFMHRLCNRADLADDLAQQVFLKIWKSIHQIKVPGAFNGWLHKVMISIWLEDLGRNKLEFAEWNESLPMEAHNESPGVRIFVLQTIISDRLWNWDRQSPQLGSRGRVGSPTQNSWDFCLSPRLTCVFFKTL
jgi:RNA polymerase sigma factor (sigma-70 family)